MDRPRARIRAKDKSPYNGLTLPSERMAQAAQAAQAANLHHPNENRPSGNVTMTNNENRTSLREEVQPYGSENTRNCGMNTNPMAHRRTKSDDSRVLSMMPWEDVAQTASRQPLVDRSRGNVAMTNDENRASSKEVRTHGRNNRIIVESSQENTGTYNPGEPKLGDLALRERLGPSSKIDHTTRASYAQSRHSERQPSMKQSDRRTSEIKGEPSSTEERQMIAIAVSEQMVRDGAKHKVAGFDEKGRCIVRRIERIDRINRPDINGGTDRNNLTLHAERIELESPDLAYSPSTDQSEQSPLFMAFDDVDHDGTGEQDGHNNNDISSGQVGTAAPAIVDTAPSGVDDAIGDVGDTNAQDGAYAPPFLGTGTVASGRGDSTAAYAPPFLGTGTVASSVASGRGDSTAAPAIVDAPVVAVERPGVRKFKSEDAGDGKPSAAGVA